MQIEIQDDFDLEKISSCGQCFRVKFYDDGTYRFITGDHIIRIRKSGENTYEVSSSENEWNKIWRTYFDLGRDYRKLREQEGKKHPFVQEAVECGRGLRVLRQDPWEMLVTFIISQRKSIPAIAKAVELLAEKYGHLVETECDRAMSFPTPEELQEVTEEELRECGLGYRARYVYDAVDKVASGKLDLTAIADHEDALLFQELLTVYGVGKKVADCVCLFGYGRTARAPVDVWIARAIREECGGENPFPLFGGDAGIIQQYIFYYKKNISVRTGTN